MEVFSEYEVILQRFKKYEKSQNPQFPYFKLTLLKTVVITHNE